MLRFFRNLPRVLLVEPENADSFGRWMRAREDFIFAFEVDPNLEFRNRANFDELKENSVVVYTVEKLTRESVDTGYHEAYVLNADMEFLLMDLVNQGRHLVRCIRQTPQMLALRVVGDVDRVLEKLLSDLEGEMIPITEMLRGKAEGAYVCLTRENVDQPLVFDAFHPMTVYTKMPFKDLLDHISHYSLKYVNVGLRNRAWYELKIKIYDSYGRYKEQYQRLTYIIDQLNLGIVAGESWGKDAATVFLSVGIYEVKLFTYHEPTVIKSVLVGLEYDLEGNRMVDLDLYHYRRKIRWDRLKTDRIYRKTPVGIEARRELLERLKPEQTETLLAMEKNLKS